MSIITALALIALVLMLAGWTKGFLRPNRIFHLANVAEGQSLHGQKTYTAVSTGSLRYLIAKLGATPLNADIAGQADEPLGIFTDQPTAGDPIAVALLGAAEGTQKVAINSAVADGDLLTPDANGYARTLPAANGTYWVFGRATLPTTPAAAGDTIEFIPRSPVKATVNAGVITLGF